MASSWAKETDAKVNFTKLCRLLYDGGTLAVRSVFDHYCPASSLAIKLNTWKPKLQNLRGTVLNNDQWNKLYPPNGPSPKSEDFDITLLFVLLRNICGLKQPATGWNALPSSSDKTLEANLARVKFYRNIVAHSKNAEFGHVMFENYWIEISAALTSMGLKKEDIIGLKYSPLGQHDYKKLVHDWCLAEKKIQSDLHCIKKDTSMIKNDTTGIKKDTSEIKLENSKIKNDVAGLKKDTSDIKSNTTEIRDIVLKNSQSRRGSQVDDLADCSFASQRDHCCSLFSPNSRQWILSEVASHVAETKSEASRVIVIKAGPGVGKTVLAAKLCQIYEERGILAGCHFFQYNNSPRNNPRLMLQSIARQMCDSVPDFKAALISKLETDLGGSLWDFTCVELFTVLFEEPFSHVSSSSNHVIIIDALDECDDELKDELLYVLNSKLSLLPAWIRIVITTRSLPANFFIPSKAEIDIDPEEIRNQDDIKLFFNIELNKIFPNFHDPQLFKNLVAMSKGYFLVAFFAVKFLKEGTITSATEVLNLFPDGICSVYEYYFLRLCEVMKPFIHSQEDFFQMLDTLVAAQNPLPQEIFYEVLNLKDEREISHLSRGKRDEAMQLLSTLFPITNNHVTTFHKSVIDWLMLKGKEHKFSVSEEKGNEILSNVCWKILSDVRNGDKELELPLNLTECEKYALRHGLEHMKRSFEHQEIFSYFTLAAIMSDQHSVYSAGFNAPGRFDTTSYYGFSKNTVLKINEGLKSIFETCKDLCKSGHLHKEECPFFYRPKFSHYLAVVLQLAQGITEELTPKPIDFLEEHRFPYYNVESLVLQSTPPFRGKSKQSLVLHEQGFIAIYYDRRSRKSAVYSYKKNGIYTSEKIFDPGFIVMSISPDNQFLVLADLDRGKIKVVDVRDLHDVTAWDCSRDKIDTCHVYGNQEWYIVLKFVDNDKIFILEWLTGRLNDTFSERNDDRIKDVSCTGHILVSRTHQDGRKHYVSTGSDEIVLEGKDEPTCECLPKLHGGTDKTITIFRRWKTRCIPEQTICIHLQYV